MDLYSTDSSYWNKYDSPVYIRGYSVFQRLMTELRLNYNRLSTTTGIQPKRPAGTNTTGPFACVGAPCCNDSWMSSGYTKYKLVSTTSCVPVYLLFCYTSSYVMISETTRYVYEYTQ